MTRVRVGVVGAAGIRGGMLHRFDRHDDATVTALCDLDEAGLAAAAEGLDVETYTDYDEMLTGAPLDAVFVTTPQPLHADHSIRALERDLHVLSEVGSAVTLEGARELVAAAENADAQYMLAENTCYFREHVLVRELIEGGHFGDLYYAEGAYLHDLKELTAEETPWRRDDLLGHPGITYPTHQIGPVLQWFGDDRIECVTCAGSGHHYVDPDGVPYEADDTSVLLGKTAEGRLVEIRQDIISNRPPPKRFNQYELQGTAGCFQTNPAHDIAGETEPPDLIWLKEYHDTEDPHARPFVPLEEFESHLPERYRDPPSDLTVGSHFGADYYLVDDFVTSVAAGDPVPIGVHRAMDITLPGVVSREVDTDAGEWREVPDSREWV